MIRGRQIARVGQALGMTYDVAGSDELILLQEWYNEGIVDVLQMVHCYVDIGDMPLQVGVTNYRTDASILAVLDDKITSQSQGFEFQVVPLKEVLESNLSNYATNSTVSRVAFEGTLMIVSPAPTYADTIQFYYVPMPTQVAADGTTANDTIDPSNATYGGIPTQFHLAIEYYMLWRGAEYDDKKAPMTAKDYRQAYESLCGTYRKRHRGKAGRGLRPAKVGYPGRGGPGRRNDVYPER